MLNLQNLKPWEEVLMAVRRHWIIYVFLFINFLVWVIISIILLMVFADYVWCYFLLSIFWLAMASLLYIKWLDHELDMFVITNNRIIGVEQMGFLNRSLWECNLWQVQDVKSQTKWLLSNVFDYGTLTIQTAWNATNFQMHYAPHVIQRARKILNVVDDYRDTEAGTNGII